MNKISNQFLIFPVILFLLSFPILLSCSDNDDDSGEINGVVRSGDQVIPNTNIMTQNSQSYLKHDPKNDSGFTWVWIKSLTC